MDESWSTPWMIQVSTGNFMWRLSLTNPCTGYPTTQGPQGDEIARWIAQMILSVPVPALLIYEITGLLSGALPQTLIDGSSAGTGQ